MRVLSIEHYKDQTDMLAKAQNIGKIGAPASPDNPANSARRSISNVITYHTVTHQI